MKKINYLIVDDEPIAHDIITGFASDLISLHKIGDAFNAMQANQMLIEHSIDLIFLDIEMPKLKGTTFLKTLANPPKVIITSAYQEYAIEGYNLNVVDYLLKPFSFARFLQAVNKVEIEKPSSLIKNKIETTKESIFVKSDKKIHQVQLSDIFFLESLGSYVTINTSKQKITTLQRLQHFEQVLINEEFVRVHKSFIIAMSKIQSIEGNAIFIKNQRIPIGRTYKLNLMKRIKLG
jgi:DNA-binding LytR/AlgR family response regulator